MAYQKIDDSFWTDPDVMALNIECTLLLLYLMTRMGGHYSGIYFATEATLTEGSKLSSKGFEKAMKVLSGWTGVISKKPKPFVKYDKKLQIVWVVNMTKHQLKLGNRCNQIIGINKHLRTLHDSFLVAEYREKYKELSAEVVDRKTGEILKAIRIELPEDYKASSSEAVIPAPEKVKGKRPYDISIPKTVIDYLNDKLDTRFVPSNKETQRLIKSRTVEGFTVEDFKRVIDRKAKKWKGDPEMQDFLRPSTLFGNKFEGYVNEKEVSDDGKHTGLDKKDYDKGAF